MSKVGAFVGGALAGPFGSIAGGQFGPSDKKILGEGQTPLTPVAPIIDVGKKDFPGPGDEPPEASIKRDAELERAKKRPGRRQSVLTQRSKRKTGRSEELVGLS